MANLTCTSTSCNCGKCQFLKAPQEIGTPTNMSVRNCQFSPYYDCYNSNIFRADIEPRNKKGYTILNPQLNISHTAPDFIPVVCPVSSGCNNTGSRKPSGFVSNDPRLVSVAHGGQVLTLDRPPTDSTVRLEDINTDDSLRKYGQCYKNYSDINAGQITYYIDKSIQDPFFEPVFSTPALAVGEVYKDPMGAFKPQYTRYIANPNEPCGKTDCFPGCLSWIDDSTFHREDLMASQMRKHNEQRYEPRWFGYNK